MNTIDKPAFPGENHYHRVDGMIMRAEGLTPGMSLRVHAAIELRVPESGIPQLDDMIRESRRLDAAAQVLPAIIEQNGLQDIYDHKAAVNEAFTVAGVMHANGRQACG